MNELLQYSPLATFAVVMVAVIGSVLRRGGDEASSTATATTTAATAAATTAATGVMLASIKEALDHVGTTMEHVDGTVREHERRLIKIETVCSFRHEERRQEANVRES